MRDRVFCASPERQQYFGTTPSFESTSSYPATSNSGSQQEKIYALLMTTVPLDEDNGLM